MSGLAEFAKKITQLVKILPHHLKRKLEPYFAANIAAKMDGKTKWKTTQKGKPAQIDVVLDPEIEIIDDFSLTVKGDKLTRILAKGTRKGAARRAHDRNGKKIKQHPFRLPRRPFYNKKQLKTLCIETITQLFLNPHNLL